jgi:hypothetical protein
MEVEEAWNLYGICVKEDGQLAVADFTRDHVLIVPLT